MTGQHRKGLHPGWIAASIAGVVMVYTLLGPTYRQTDRLARIEERQRQQTEQLIGINASMEKVSTAIGKLAIMDERVDRLEGRVERLEGRRGR